MLVDGKPWPYDSTEGAQLVSHESDTAEGRTTFVSHALNGHDHAARVCLSDDKLPIENGTITLEAVFAPIADALEDHGPQIAAQTLIESWMTPQLGIASLSAPTVSEWRGTVAKEIGCLLECCHGDGDTDAATAASTFIAAQHERLQTRLLSSQIHSLQIATQQVPIVVGDDQ